MICVRNFGPDDKGALYGFLALIWPTRSAQVLDQRWWWNSAAPPILLAEDETSAIVGICACIPFDLYVQHGEQRTGAWIVDFFVHPEKQGMGIGGSLVKAAAARYDFLASLNQTDAALGAFRRMGWSGRSIMPLYICPSVRVSSLLAFANRSSGIAVSANELHFSAEFDDLWERSRDAYAPLSVRDARFMTERFTLPHRSYKLITAHIDGRLEGYFVVRTLRKGSVRSFPNREVMLVADYLIAPGRSDVFAALLREILRSARADDVPHVMCAAVPRGFQSVLQKSGFVGPQLQAISSTFAKLGVGFTASSNAPDRRPWTLTTMDCDMDLILDSAQ